MQSVKDKTLQDAPVGFLRSSHPVVFSILQFSFSGLACSIGYALAVWAFKSQGQVGLAFYLFFFFFFLMGTCLSLGLFLLNRRRRSVGMDPLFLMPTGFLWEGFIGYRLSQVWIVMFFVMCAMFMAMSFSSSVEEVRKLVRFVFLSKSVSADQHLLFYSAHKIQMTESCVEPCL